MDDENTSPGTSVGSGGRAVKQNGTREVYHVTFAESHTEHGGTDQSEEESVIADGPTRLNGHTMSTHNGLMAARVNGHSDACGVNALGPDNVAVKKSSHLNQISLLNTSSQGSISGSTPSPTSPAVAPLTPIIKLQRSASTESHENPFTADGELSKKADYIISHSTISRTELKIEDPDQEKKLLAAEAAIQPASVGTVQSAPPSDRPNDIGVKGQNGKLDDGAVAPSSVEVVEKGNATQPEPEQAEQVKVKDSKKCKCCTIM